MCGRQIPKSPAYNDDSPTTRKAGHYNGYVGVLLIERNQAPIPPCQDEVSAKILRNFSKCSLPSSSLSFMNTVRRSTLFLLARSSPFYLMLITSYANSSTIFNDCINLLLLLMLRNLQAFHMVGWGYKLTVVASVAYSRPGYRDLRHPLCKVARVLAECNHANIVKY